MVGSSCRSIQSAPRCFVNRLARSGAIQVGTCTPLVTDDTGRSASSVPGHIGANIARVTVPWSWLTALVEPADRIASAVMLNCSPLPLSYDPSARNRSRLAPSVPQQLARCFSTMLNGNASCPAGTGVCVVNTVVFRISASASSNDAPFSMRSRIRCKTTKPACPSFRWNAPGVRPSAFSARTPPMPRMISCWIRVSRSPPYRRAVSSRSHGAFSSRLVSSRYSVTRPSRTRQTATSTDRSPSGTAVMHGLPSAASACSIGASAHVSRS